MWVRGERGGASERDESDGISLASRHRQRGRPRPLRSTHVATVLLDVLHADALEARAHGPRGLVAGEEAAAGADQLLGGRTELVRVLLEGVQ